jgi:fatty-acid desaturase
MAHCFPSHSLMLPWLPFLPILGLLYTLHSPSLFSSHTKTHMHSDTRNDPSDQSEDVGFQLVN